MSSAKCVLVSYRSSSPAIEGLTAPLAAIMDREQADRAFTSCLPAARCPTCGEILRKSRLFYRVAFEPSLLEMQGGDLVPPDGDSGHHSGVFCLDDISMSDDDDDRSQDDDEDDDDMSNFIVEDDNDEDKEGSKSQRAKVKRAVRPIIPDSDDEDCAEEVAHNVRHVPANTPRPAPVANAIACQFPPSTKMKVCINSFRCCAFY